MWSDQPARFYREGPNELVLFHSRAQLAIDDRFQLARINIWLVANYSDQLNSILSDMGTNKAANQPKNKKDSTKGA